jgi:subtilisin family serine protease
MVVRRGTYRGCTFDYAAGEIIIKVKPDTDLSEITNLLAQNEAWIIAGFDETLWGLVGTDTSENTFDKIDTFLQSPLIECSEPNILLCPNAAPSDTKFTVQWALNNTGQTGGTIDADIDALEGWEIEKGDPSLMVGVLDSGIPLDPDGNLCHADLDDPSRFIPGFNCSFGQCDSADERSVRDFEGHGTWVTGILGAETNNVEGIAGVMWYGKILVMKITGSHKCGLAYDIAIGIEKAVECGAKILNLSYGETVSCWLSGRLEAAVDSAYKGSCFVAASAGNAGIMMFPAGFSSYGTLPGHNKCCYYDPILDSTICEYATDTCGYTNVIAVGAVTADDSIPPLIVQGAMIHCWSV